jgi:hypothetical protein
VSTRSIVAFAMPGGKVKGVGVHYDGDPASMLPELVKIVERDGFVKARKAILAHPDWASIEAGEPVDPSSTPDNPLYVSGIGRWFSETGMTKATLAKCYFTPDKLAQWWDNEYVYVISATSITHAAPGVRNKRDPENDWDNLTWTERAL